MVVIPPDNCGVDVPESVDDFLLLLQIHKTKLILVFKQITVVTVIR